MLPRLLVGIAFGAAVIYILLELGVMSFKTMAVALAILILGIPLVAILLVLLLAVLLRFILGFADRKK